MPARCSRSTTVCRARRPGFGMSRGVCTSMGAPAQRKMTMAEMVSVCGASPSIPGFIGAPPAGSDPSAPCTFTGCPARSILVGTIGDPAAACVACGPHQVSTGVHPCTEEMCAKASTSATTCVDCAADQIVGGPDGNTCVSCPAFQVPSTDKKTCVSCGAHQVAMGGVCVTCPANQVAAPDGTCQACPAGQMPLSQQPAGRQARASGRRHLRPDRRMYLRRQRLPQGELGRCLRERHRVAAT